MIDLFSTTVYVVETIALFSMLAASTGLMALSLVIIGSYKKD